MIDHGRRRWGWRGFTLALLWAGGTFAMAAPRAPELSPLPAAEAGMASFDTSGVFDANEIRVVITNFGSIGYPVSGSRPGYEWPTGSGLSFGFAGGLWVGARVQDSTRVTVAEYTSEWSPGPLDADGMAVDPAGRDPAYRVYRIAPGDDLRRTPDYQNWPVELGAPSDSLGRPFFLGDETLWCVFNDAVESRHDNPVGSSLPLGLEVRATTWGYNRAGPLDQAMFVAYDIVNKGSNDLRDTYVALWFDDDLGGAGDDLVGCDTLLALGYTYNAGDSDYVYHEHPPAFGCALIQGPVVSGDTLGMHAFGRLLKDYTEPMNRADAYWRMEHGVWDSTLAPVFHDCNPPGTRYEVSGDPVAGTGCRDTIPADRRFLWSTGPFDLPPGAEQRIVVSLIVGGHFGDGDWLSSMTDLRERAAAARAAYFHPPGSLPSGASLFAMPNPAFGVQLLPVRMGPVGGTAFLRVFDLAGRLVRQGEFANLGPGLRWIEWDGRGQGGREVPAGPYFLQMRDPEGTRTVKVVRLRRR